MKQCPFCAQEIQDAAMVCRHCRRPVLDDEWRAFCERWRMFDEVQRQREWVAMPPPQRERFQAAWAALGYQTMPGQPQDLGDNAGMRWLLPVGRSGWAIAAGYLGLLSLILVPAPFALATGIIAVVSIRRNPRLHGMGRAIFGIVMGALGTIGLVITLVSLLARNAWR